MQLSLCAEHLRSAGGVGFVVGDFNAISPRDSALAEEVGVLDAEPYTLIGMRATRGVEVEEMLPAGRSYRAAVLDMRPVSVTVLPSGLAGNTLCSGNVLGLKNLLSILCPFSGPRPLLFVIFLEGSVTSDVFAASFPSSYVGPMD